MFVNVPETYQEPLYVAGMNVHPAFDKTNQYTIEIVNPPAQSTDAILAVTTVAAGDEVEIADKEDEHFGRPVRINSTDAGDVIVYGKDYLGQLMTEQVTCIVGSVNAAKAFKEVLKVESVDVDGDISVGWANPMGLPFTTLEILHIYANGAASTVSALTQADTNEATATTGDVRGTFNPAATANGATTYKIVAIADTSTEAGLHGERQA